VREFRRSQKGKKLYNLFFLLIAKLKSVPVCARTTLFRSPRLLAWLNRNAAERNRCVITRTSISFIHQLQYKKNTVSSGGSLESFGYVSLWVCGLGQKNPKTKIHLSILLVVNVCSPVDIKSNIC